MTTTSAPPEKGGLYKSAVLLAALGTDLAARILGQIEPACVEPLVRELTQLGHVPAIKRDGVIEEFHRRLMTDHGVSVGGIGYARNLLEQALGPEDADRILDDLSSGQDTHASLDRLLTETAPERLAAVVVDEHPQLIALLMSRLPVDASAALLSALPADLRTVVVARVAQLEAPAPVALQHLERCLKEKLSAGAGGAATAAEGPRRAADILGRTRRSVEDSVIASLEERSPELAQKVNQFRFTFEDVLRMDGRSLQRVLRDLDADTLRIAMKGLDEERQQVIYANMSERAAARLREELENTGPTRLRDVETAQQTIVSVTKSLAEQGEVQLKCADCADEEEALV